MLPHTMRPTRSSQLQLPAINNARTAFLTPHWLAGLLQHVYQIPGMLELVLREECIRRTRGASAACAADTVHVVLNRSWEVVIDHVLDILHIKSPRRDVRGN